MPEPSFPWEDSPQITNTVKKIPVRRKREITITEGTTPDSGSGTQLDEVITTMTEEGSEKLYGIGKPYRIVIKGDITSDSRRRET